MKTLKHLINIVPLLFLLSFFCLPFESRAQIEIDTSNMGPPEQDPTLDELKDTLSKSGDWVQINESELDPDSVEGEDYNTVDEDVNTDYIWIPSPTIIYVGWNPYMNGRWVWTCWGWQWIPYDNWGWCTYHYGRWWHHHRYGWVWSPGHRWRHCWVTWYRTSGYWGWHPLPPRIHYRGGIAVIPRVKDVENDGWVFVNKKDFTKTIDKTTIVDARKHTEIFANTNENVQEKEKKTQTLGPNVSVPDTKKQDTKNTEPKTEKKTNDYGTPNEQGKKEVNKKTENNSNYNSGNNKSNDSWYTPPKTETKQSPPPKVETKQSPPPKQETKQSPPPQKTEEKQSPPPQKSNDSNTPQQKKDNSSGN